MFYGGHKLCAELGLQGRCRSSTSALLKGHLSHERRGTVSRTLTLLCWVSELHRYGHAPAQKLALYPLGSWIHFHPRSLLKSM